MKSWWHTQYFQATESFQRTTVTLNHFILYNGLEYCQLVMQTMVFIIKKKKKVTNLKVAVVNRDLLYSIKNVMSLTYLVTQHSSGSSD